MPSVKCFGVCRGVPGWLDPRTNLVCTVCSGSGVYTSPPPFGEQCAAIAKRVRLSHSAIITGDEDAPVKGKPRKRWKKPRRLRMTKARRAILARDARRKEMDAGFAAFKATRPPDWEKQLDELKAGFRK